MEEFCVIFIVCLGYLCIAHSFESTWKQFAQNKYMYCILTLSDIVWKFWDEMAGLEEQRHVCSWILPLRVSHFPFIPCLHSFLCLFIYSDIKERVQKALGFLYSMLKDISPFMAYHYWVKSWHEIKLSVFWTKEVQMLIDIVCFVVTISVLLWTEAESMQ